MSVVLVSLYFSGHFFLDTSVVLRYLCTGDLFLNTDQFSDKSFSLAQCVKHKIGKALPNLPTSKYCRGVRGGTLA